MKNDNAEFWIKHCEIVSKSSSFYNDSFVELFNGMTQADPQQRFTIKQIRKSKWYNGPVYSSFKLQSKMRKIIGQKQNS